MASTLVTEVGMPDDVTPSEDRETAPVSRDKTPKDISHRLQTSMPKLLGKASHVQAKKEQTIQRGIGRMTNVDTGGYSSTTKYISAKCSETERFLHIQKQMEYISASKSPFIPTNLSEHLSQKAWAEDVKLQRLKYILAGKIATAEKGLPKLGKALLAGRKMEFDAVSPVLALQSIWVDKETDMETTTWPSIAERKHEGDDRASKGFGRTLPLPRLKTMDARLQQLRAASGQDTAAAGEVLWQDRAVLPMGGMDAIRGHGTTMTREAVYDLREEVVREEMLGLLDGELLTALDS